MRRGAAIAAGLATLLAAAAWAQGKATQLGPREVPPPRFASDAARAAAGRRPAALPAWPAPSDTEGWRRLQSQMNAAKAASTTPLMARLPVDVSASPLGGVPVYLARPRGERLADARRVILAFHGGALVFYGGEANVRFEAASRALMTGCAVYAVDYRVPPDHPFPAALDDAETVYRELLKAHAARDVVVLGDAGGAGLAAALLLRIGRDGLPTPGGAILLTPEIDLTEAGDTFTSLMGLDTGFTGSLLPVSRFYAGAAELTNPLVSPIFGDVSKFPPTFLQSGTRDVLLSSAVVMHRKLRKAGVRAELHVWEAMPHGGFGPLTPETGEVGGELRAFIASL